ncbi:hypothetical protein B9T25_00685 [Acinetobacter sp. ANC 4470]|nr:hypothetical protein B9T25_00685 [Acinetobacter sp. ANC 4470]
MCIHTLVVVIFVIILGEIDTSYDQNEILACIILLLVSIDICCTKNSESVKFNLQIKFTARYTSYNADESIVVKVESF